eukprot:EG_transcript_10286
MGCLASCGRKDKERSHSAAALSVTDGPGPADRRPQSSPASPQPDRNGQQAPERMGYAAMVKQLYEALVCSIIRPPRAQYNIHDLGPVNFAFCGRQHRRRDFQLTNSRNLTLQCSHWEPTPADRPAPRLPCVVYLHGNSSSRAEAMDVLNTCLAAGITVVGLDFAGSGLSDGEYVSLGHFERLDLETVVGYLKAQDSVSSVAAWGHSMGAVTAILHAAAHPTTPATPTSSSTAPVLPSPGPDLSLAGIVVDSAFTDLEGLAQELVRDGKLLPMAVPGVVVSGALRMIRGTIQKRAGFDIKQLSPIKAAPKCTTPAFLGHGKGDEFIPPHHSKQLHDKYWGPVELVLFEGDHNSLRPQSFLDGAVQFLSRVMPAAPELACPRVPPRWGRLPWHQSRGARTARSAVAAVVEAEEMDRDLEAAILLSLAEPNRGRGTNNSLAQQLQQQQQDVQVGEKRDEELIARLTELGFPEDSAREAAQRHKSMEGAVLYLLEGQ